MNITDDSDARKNIPLARGLLDYFPAALAEVARLSKAGNDKHNPGEELHHARGKSSDHADCILRHLTDRGCVDSDGFLHDVKVAWRALAMLQEALEARGAKFARGARADADYLEDLDDLRTIHARKDEPTLTLDELLNSTVSVCYDTRPPLLGVLLTDDPDYYRDDEVQVDAYGRVTSTVEPFTFTEAELADLRAGELLDEVLGFGDVDALDADRDESVVDALYCSNAISNRIAGDSPEAKAIKNPYYGHDPHVIRGYCANCDRELKVDDEHLVNNPGFDKSVLFCSLSCRSDLRDWQGR